MDNNYLFWESYLEKIKDKILELCLSKKELQIDFHIHSNHSADGKQTVKEIIETTKNKGFDIISITDHDSVSVYDEIYNLVKEEITSPIIIPGIEFTIDIRKIEISEFINLITSKISIIDINIDSGNIDDLIVKLYEDFKIWNHTYRILN